MADKPEIKDEDLKKTELKTVTTNVAGDAPDPALVASIEKQWQGTIEKTQASDAYKGINWNAAWIEKLKGKPAGEQGKFFAEGVATGLAFAE
eukprot:augustus_masked-scaffold_71-processed-gene-0.60-mRNA-1 protein AED:1.00 eAED:1.00 QI:0/-1/0/0/-1/1/1/0/91